jgi:hypothetical protein
MTKERWSAGMCIDIAARVGKNKWRSSKEKADSSSSRLKAQTTRCAGTPRNDSEGVLLTKEEL